MPPLCSVTKYQEQRSDGRCASRSAYGAQFSRANACHCVIKAGLSPLSICALGIALVALTLLTAAHRPLSRVQLSFAFKNVTPSYPFNFCQPDMCNWLFFTFCNRMRSGRVFIFISNKGSIRCHAIIIISTLFLQIKKLSRTRAIMKNVIIM